MAEGTCKKINDGNRFNMVKCCLKIEEKELRAKIKKAKAVCQERKKTQESYNMGMWMTTNMIVLISEKQNKECVCR